MISYESSDFVFLFVFTIGETVQGQKQKKGSLLLTAPTIVKRMGKIMGYFSEERCPETLLLEEFKS